MAALVAWVLLLTQLCAVSCIAAEQGFRRSRRLSGSRIDGWEGFGKGGGGVGVSAVDLQKGVGRKLLQQQSTDDMNDSKVRRQNNLQSSLFKPKHLAMAIPVAFVICCGLLCPCFQPRRKGSAEVLVKDPSSRDSISSFGTNFTSDKTTEYPLRAPASPLQAPASPLRPPPSPLRPPPSPLRAPPSPSRFSPSPQMNRLRSVRVNMNEVNRATKNFSSALKIGEGGFATVYKAQLQDGQVVAIKRAKMEHFDALQTEFSSEIELLAKIEHRNLVKLLGYVEKGNERIIITEYVRNGTLREHLDGQHGNILDFNQRLEIAIDVAHGLTYLHLYAEKPIIHRDVKSSNILLTESMRAKVADFGFARLGLMEKDQSHIVTKVKGTAGYLDPQYMRTYQLTPKSDVYSFGILLIEILSGRRPVESKRNAEERVTVRWAFTKYNEGKAAEILDPQMKEKVNGKVVSKLLHLAVHCAAPTRLDRPTMKEVGEILWRIRSDYIISLKK